MRYIPREMLIHSAELRSPLSEDSFGNVIWSEAVKLEFIRIDEENKVGFSGMNKPDSGSALLIYDCRNSRPRNLEFAPGQQISFGGKDYTISAVRRLYGKNRLHHIEAELI